MNQSRHEIQVCKIPHKMFSESQSTNPVFIFCFLILRCNKNQKFPIRKTIKKIVKDAVQSFR